MQTVRRRTLLAGCSFVLALAAVMPVQQAAAAPGNVGTAVYVVIRNAFTATPDDDQCVGASSLAPVRRGSSVVLSEGLPGALETPKVAVGVFHRSRLKDATCQVLYITSAPVMSDFNVQFAGPGGELSPTFGPIRSDPVTDQPGIEQALTVDMEFGPTG